MTLKEVCLVGGELLMAHRREVCVPPCALHQPSDHHMVRWNQHWRYDRGIIERICRHGIGHPDPDDIRLRLGEDSGVHGCDRCCSQKYRDQPCGCSYLHHGDRVEFLERCDTHAPMCRALERWEIDLF